MRLRGTSVVSSICILVGLSVLARGGLWIAAERRFQAGLAQARTDINAQRFEPAATWLAAQSTSRPDHAETAFLLGVCEDRLGHHQAAVNAWARVPAESSFGATAITARAQTLVNELGRFADAEAALTKALSQFGARTRDLRYSLNELYYWEGRLDEMRRLLQDGWSKSTDKAGDLQDLWLIDSAVVMIDPIRTIVERAAAKSPDDDRVWLARANIALLSGRLPEAEHLLDACLKRRPEDPAVWRNRLRWARAAGTVGEARRALEHVPAENFTEAEAVEIRAWFAARAGRLDEERNLLEQLIARRPSETQALDRLAVLAAQAGQSARAAELRERKDGIDRAKARYFRLLEPGNKVSQFTEVAELAEKLGRGFEARGWWFLASRSESGALATAAVDRLGPPRPERGLPTGGTMAAYLGERVAPAHAGKTPVGPIPATVALPAAPALASTSTIITPQFRDDAASVGLRFVFDNGRSPLRQLPETTAGGVGLFDYDGDGWLDVYLVQGGAFPPDPRRPPTGDRLFRNRGDGTFEDATERSGIAKMKKGYGHGVTVGDFDNDGHADLFVTRWRAYALYQNRGDGTFEDMTDRAGLAGDRDWPTSAAFADLDNDGDLDLYVCHYLVWDADHPTLCKFTPKPGVPVDPNHLYEYCMPNPFPSRPDHLFRNDGGRFVDVTAEAGIVDPNGRGLGIVTADVDDDGLIDLFVANDTTANYLWHNLGGMKFEEIGVSSGVACNAQGAFQAGMGTAVGDMDGDGLSDLMVTNFYGESTSFFKNLAAGAFADRTAMIGLAAPSRYVLGFGIVAVDVNNDGRLDLAQTNGHVVDNRPDFPLEMPGLLLTGGTDGRLVDVTQKAGSVWSVPRIGRALAAGDLDNDGRIDLVVVPQDGPVVYLHNQTPVPATSTVSFMLEGTKSNRDGVGAVVTLTIAGHRRRAWRFGGGSYQSASDPRVRFGLGADRINEVEVRWPSGQIDRLSQVEAGGCYRVREGDKALSPPRGWPVTGSRRNATSP